MKLFRLFLISMLFMLNLTAKAQTEDVALGTSENNYIPIYGFGADNASQHSQVIYPVSKIPQATLAGALITKMTFYLKSTPNWGKLSGTVRLMNTSTAYFSSSNFISVTSATEVYSGSLQVVNNQLVISFQNAFPYEEGSNLLLDITCGGGTFGAATFLGSPTTTPNYASYFVAGSTSSRYLFCPGVTVEYTPSTTPRVVTGQVSNVTNNSLNFNGQAFNITGDLGFKYNVDGGAWQYVPAQTNGKDMSYPVAELSPGSIIKYYAFGVKGVADTVWGSEVSHTMVLAIAHVTTGGAGLMNGSSWANAYSASQLQNAITAAANEVHIAGGEYTTTSPYDNNTTFRIAKANFKISGAWDPATNTQKPQSISTVLKANGNRRVLLLDAAAPTVSYLTVTEGNTSTGQQGAGIRVSNNAGDAIIENCTIAANRYAGNSSNSDGGAGIFVASYNTKVTINNCLIVNNQCNGSGQAWAAGVCVQDNATSSTVLNFCTIACNMAGGNEAQRTGVQSLRVNNCILWRNGGNNAVQSVQGYSVVVNTSAYDGMSLQGTATNRIAITNSNTALFINPNTTCGYDANWANYNWRVNPESVVAKASNMSLSTITTDILGMPRQNGAALGAYEKNLLMTLAVTDLTSTSATLHGSYVVANASDFRGFQYREAGTTNNWNIVAADNDLAGQVSTALLHIASSTTFEYQFIVISDGQDTAKGTLMQFTTKDFCFPPTDLTMNLANGNTEITWDATNGETEWVLSYKNAIDNPWTDVTVKGVPAYTLTGQTDFKNQSIKVKAVCASDNHSAYSDEYAGFVIYYNLYGGNCHVNGTLHTPDDNTFVYNAYRTTFVPVDGYHTTRIVMNGIDVGAIDQFYFYGIKEDQYIDIYVEKTIYTISTTGYGAGTISAGKTINTLTDNYVLTVTPATGHHIEKVLINGIPENITNVASYTKTIPAPILSDYTIEAYFKLNTYKVTATAGAGGFITPNGITYYNWNASSVYTATAEQGYFIVSATVNNVTQTVTQYATTWTYPINNITADYMIDVKFAKFNYTITSSVNNAAGGSISPTPTRTVAYGASQAYTITVNNGWELTSVEIDGINVGTMTSYTFPSVTKDYLIKANFAKRIYTVTTTTANAGGTITQSGKHEYQTSPVYAVTANTGYTIASVTIDGAPVSIPANATTWSRTFTNIDANHTMSATFAINTYTVTVTQPANVTIIPTGTTTVEYGSDIELIVTPAEGYRLTEIRVNNSPVSFTANAFGEARHIIRNITANYTVTAAVEKMTYTITVNAGTGGTISPVTASINHGDSRTFTIAPNPSYEIARVLIDGVPAGSISTYTFNNVAENHTITAEFRILSCEIPSFLYAIDIDTTSAKLVWENTGVFQYELQWKIYTDTLNGFITIQNLTITEYELTNLTPATRYAWRVKAICTNQGPETAYSPAALFTTLPVPPANSGTGINGVTKIDIQVYSFRDNVYIVNEMGLNIEGVSIFDIYGRTVYQGSVNSNREEIALHVADGIYMVRLLTADGVRNYKVNIQF